MSDKISVIVPVYNLEKYIERTVASIQNQTYQNLEIILVNDGSKDNSLELLRQLEKSDSRIKVLSQENAGVTCARFAGVEAAAGEWIGFVDGDDYIDPDMYERLLSNAHNYSADISHCGYKMVFPRHIDYYYNTGSLAEQDRITALKELLSGSRIEPGLCNKLFHKSLFHSLLHSGKMDFSIKNMEDLLMNFYLFQAAERSVYEDFCPYHYIVRKDSAATGKLNENKLRDPLRVLQTIHENLGEAESLNVIVDRRILAQRIRHATMLDGDSRELIAHYRKAARYEIRKNLMPILRGRYSKKQKFFALWVAVWPQSYTLVHTVYSRITGTDRKYSVE